MGFNRGTTRTRIVKLHMATWPLVAAMRDTVKPLAARRPSELVSPAIHTQGKTLLDAARRVLSREPVPRQLLNLDDVPDWATLLSRLELAMTALEAFRRRYSAYDDDLGEVVWHDEVWLSFRLRQDEYANDDNDLDEI